MRRSPPTRSPSRCDALRANRADNDPRMRPFRIVAHRGAPTSDAPENTRAAFQRAFELGADAVELDVRLTRDHVPVVYHYFYLDEVTTGAGPIFQHTVQQLRDVRVIGTDRHADGHAIPTLADVLGEFGSRIRLDVELKGPEPEAAEIVGDVLGGFRDLWDTIEVTAFEPSLLRDVRRACPGIATAVLFPRSEDWMHLDVVAYAALNRARLAQAQAVHLHPTQLTADVAARVRAGAVEIHAWQVNDPQTLQLAADLDVPSVCTDQVEQAVTFVARYTRAAS
jgi:glycerophosphoryl diester phosphodiesterase